MAIRDQDIHPAANFPKKHLVAAFITAIDLTTAVVFSFLPGYKYQITAIRTFCQTKAGTVTATVKVGSRTAASITFTAATEVAQTLSTTIANLRGSATEAITVVLTTDHTGVLANSFAVITIRPFPLSGEVGP